MIITRLNGGLGNQMFQYAAGLRLASARRTELKLDLSMLEDPEPACATPRGYELGPLRVAAERASPDEVESLVALPGGGLAGWLRGRRGRASPAVERHFHFDPDVLALPDGVYLRGYWQSERYFADAADRIRRELTVEEPLARRNAEVYAAISACNAVCLHVRRGDYVTDAVTHATHGVCSLDYYRHAAAYLAERVPDPHFYLFSDDPEWTRSNLVLPHPTTLVDHNGTDRCHEDLRLMSRCEHHIIANSSFSWWAAWLGESPDKIVVAPKHWFRDGEKNCSDLLPASWVKL